MSFDICMNVEPCRTCGGTPDWDDVSISPTYNISPMFVRALGKENGIRSLSEKTGAQCQAPLVSAMNHMQANPSIYEALNPSNGWGNAKGALETLRTMLVWCKKYPDGIIEIS